MEAEISAATLLDDNPDSPFALMSSASSSSIRHRKHEDEESLSETLPENLVSLVLRREIPEKISFLVQVNWLQKWHQLAKSKLVV